MFFVGSTRDWTGIFTELIFFKHGLRHGGSHALESALGFHPGRLDAGFSLLLLNQKPRVHEVNNPSLTNRSDGQGWPPNLNVGEDAPRPLVDEKYQADQHQMWAEYKDISPEVQKIGTAWSDYEAAYTAVASIKIAGPRRAAAIVPVTPYDENMPPADQYPGNARVPRFQLPVKTEWLVAANVRADGDWETLPGWPPLTRAFLRDPRSFFAMERVMDLLADA